MAQQRWDLDSLFAGGSAAVALRRHLEQLDEGLQALGRCLDEGVTGAAVLALQELALRAKEADSFIDCLQAQDVNDGKAGALRGVMTDLLSSYQNLAVSLAQKLAALDEAAFNLLMQEPALPAIAYHLREMRTLAQGKMTLAQESLANELAVDGYHGWWDLYAALIGKLQVAVTVEGQATSLPLSQADNLADHRERAVRRAAFEGKMALWRCHEELFAKTLNHMGGFRLKLHRRRGWDSPLREPLELNRMQASTLEAMWSAVDPYKELLCQYLTRKAQLLGVDRLCWYDLNAPLGDAVSHTPYDDAAALIVEQFAGVSEEMAAFAGRAFAQRWVEAEDRPAKQPGAFCADFPLSGQTRVFMTYSGSATNLSTLAHELGHAYHSHVMAGQPYFCQDYRMNVAETASTFAEEVLLDGLLRRAGTPAQQVALLDNALQRAVTFLMDIRARYDFELRFYEERRHAPLEAARLCQLMETAQRTAYGDALDVWYPYLWAAKGHFYFTTVPFYNFPYTFGYLFSLGVYGRRRHAGFAERYRALLADTGRMDSEALARKHLDADLGEPAFWDGALQVVAAKCRQFLALTER